MQQCFVVAILAVAILAVAILATVLPAAGKGYMGKKDIVDRPYFSDCERFAELMNVALYYGKRVILPEDLILQKRKYPSLSNNCSETERDVLMKDARRNIYYGIEIETESDYSMPQRVMAYDACEYEYQMKELDRGHRDRKDYQGYRERKSRMKESDFLLPTVTVVLYLREGHWEGRRELSQMFRVPGESRKLLGGNLHDYTFPLIEADHVNPEDYNTDLKEFFRAMQCRRDREKLKELFRTEAFQHLSTETEHTIARHLRIERLIRKMEREEVPMCKAFDDLMKEERREGRREGKQEGRREGKREGRREEKIRIIRQMVKEGLDESLIRRMTKCTKEELAEAGRPA